MFENCWKGVCSLFGIRNCEEPDYDLVVDQKPFQLRHYHGYTRAFTKVTGKLHDKASVNTAFRRLCAYIFGRNRTGPVIEMTAPVVKQSHGGTMEMSFILPQRYTASVAPEPQGVEGIDFEDVPPHTAAVIRYGGRSNPETYDNHRRELLAWMEDRGLSPSSEPVLALYNPTITPGPFRTNEIIVRTENHRHEKNA